MTQNADGIGAHWLQMKYGHVMNLMVPLMPCQKGSCRHQELFKDRLHHNS